LADSVIGLSSLDVLRRGAIHQLTAPCPQLQVYAAA